MMHWWPTRWNWQRSIGKCCAVGGEGCPVVELQALLSQVEGELAEVSASPSVDTGVEDKVGAALCHQLHPSTPPLLGHQAHHVWQRSNFC